MNKDKKRKILVIDADLPSCNMIAQTLEYKGFDVLFAASPEEGIDMARKIEPELIFISLLLPGSNGLKVSKSIHSIENLKQVPVIVLISYAGELDPKYTATIGIVDVLVKPLNTEQIITKTLNLLGEETALSGIEKSEQESSHKEEFESFALSDRDDEEISAFTESESELSAETIEPLKTEEDATETDDGHSIHELFDESSKQDLKAFVSEGSGIEAEGHFDEELNEEIIDEAKYISDLHDEKESTREIQQNETELNESTDYGSFTESERSSSKKIVLIIASLFIIAGIGFGAFLLKKTYLNTGNEIESAFLEETPEKNKTALKETIQETSPAEKEKTKEVVPPPSVEKSKEVSVPIKEINKPAFPVQSKSIAKEPLSQKESKTSAEKTKITYSVQAGIFSKRKNAVFLVNKLKQKGYAAFIKKAVTAEKKILYRVLIGRFDKKQKALHLSKVIQQKEGVKTTIHHN